VLGFEDFRVGIGRHVDRRSEKDYGTSEWSGKQKVVPRFLESFSAVNADVEDEDGAAGFSGKHDRAGFGDVPRAARAVDSEGAIDALFETASHDGQAAEAASRGTSLSCAEAEPFDHLASPLTVEGRGVHDHDAVIAMPPDNRDDDAMPEGPDAALA